MRGKTISDLKVEDVEKRRHPSKHYVYIVRVTWSDGSVQIIYRRYSHFFDLQNKLLDEFPKEAGTNDPAERTIPFLPGKILFGRSHTRDVALKRLEPINDYCKALIRLATHISQCDTVLHFFDTRQDDLLPQREPQDVSESQSATAISNISEPWVYDQYVAIADYTAADSASKGRGHEVSLRAGEVLEVLEKSDKGWWFVSCEEGQGWAPSSYLERADGIDDDRLVQEEDSQDNDTEIEYVSLTDYQPKFNDELRLEKGLMVTVLEKNLEGWWLAQTSTGDKGRVPACYLSKADSIRAKQLMKKHGGKGGVEIIQDLSAISPLHKPSGSPKSSRSMDEVGQQQSSVVLSSNSKPLPPPTDIKPKFKSEQDALTSHVPLPPSAGLKPKGLVESPKLSLLRRPGIPKQDSLESDVASSDEGTPLPVRKGGPPPRRSTIRVSVWRGEGGKLTGPGLNEKPSEPEYEAMYDFKGDQVQGGANIKAKDRLEVLEKSETGWWFVRTPSSQEGWVPATSVQPVNKTEKKGPPPRPLAPPSLPHKPVSEVNSSQPAVSNHGGSSHLAAIEESSTPPSELESSESHKFTDTVHHLKSELTSKFATLMTKMKPHASPKTQRKEKRIDISQPVFESSTNKENSQRPPACSQHDDFEDEFEEDNTSEENDSGAVYENVDMEEERRKNEEKECMHSKSHLQKTPAPPSASLKPKFGLEDTSMNIPVPPHAGLKPQSNIPVPPAPPPAGLKPQTNISVPPAPPPAGLKPQTNISVPPAPPLAGLKPHINTPAPPAANLKPQTNVPAPPSAGLKPQLNTPLPPAPPPAGLKPQTPIPAPPPAGLKPQTNIPAQPPAWLKPQTNTPAPPPAVLKPQTNIPAPPPAGLKPQLNISVPPAPPPAGLTPQTNIPAPPPAGLKPQKNLTGPPPAGLKNKLALFESKKESIEPQKTTAAVTKPDIYAVPIKKSSGLNTQQKSERGDIKPLTTKWKPPTTATKCQKENSFVQTKDDASDNRPAQMSSILAKFEQKHEEEGVQRSENPFMVKLKPTSGVKIGKNEVKSDKKESPKAMKPPVDSKATSFGGNKFAAGKQYGHHANDKNNHGNSNTKDESSNIKALMSKFENK